jgi:excisionase family DNA binding protein
MRNPPLTATYFTPPEVARVLRVDVMKVLAWINRGELAAVNVASPGATRPRWRISEPALQDFLRARTATPPPPVQRRPRRRRSHVIEFFP